jgi:hypothetical protein
MTTELEDPRKTDLRTRCEAAVDAAGFTIQSERPAIQWPAGAGLKGTLVGDVVGDDGEGNRDVYFVRVDGSKPLPGWLAKATEASFAISNTRLIVVAEEPGEVLVATCRAAGVGLAKLTPANRLEIVTDYGAPDRTQQSRQFRAKLKEVRRRLDTKLRLNEKNLEESFRDSSLVTSEMSSAKRDLYLNSIETVMVEWREWGEEMAARLDALAASEDLDELEGMEREIVERPGP